MAEQSLIHMEKLGKIEDLFMIFGFSILICAPGLDHIFHLDPTPVLEENRGLAAAPRFTPDLKNLRAFPSAFDAYYRDHFGFRRFLIHYRNYVLVKWLNESTHESVVLGKNGWLFHVPRETKEIYSNERTLSEQELSDWLRVLELKRTRFAQKGIHYLFVVAPNKMSIYPEFLPKQAAYEGGRTVQDQLIDYLQKHSDFQILDLREPLRRAKPRGQLYLKADAHWTDVGAYVVYSEIVDRLQTWYPDIRKLPLGEFRIDEEIRIGGDLAKLLALKDHFRESIPRLRHPSWKNLSPIERYVAPLLDPYTAEPIKEGSYRVVKSDYPGKTLSVMLIGDSFAEAIAPFLLQHAGHFVWITCRPHPSLLPMWVDFDKPDVVIEERYEGWLAQPAL